MCIIDWGDTIDILFKCEESKQLALPLAFKNGIASVEILSQKDSAGIKNKKNETKLSPQNIVVGHSWWLIRCGDFCFVIEFRNLPHKRKKLMDTKEFVDRHQEEVLEIVLMIQKFCKA